MAKFARPEAAELARSLLFGNSRTGSAMGKFLLEELERYIPDFAAMPPDALEAFLDYQMEVYLDGKVPSIGRVIASLNPRYVDEDKIVITPGTKTYTRASVKANGYRMQVHVGPNTVKAFTRQFRNFDLRLLPELRELWRRLPVGIYDADLVSKLFKNQDSLAIVRERFPLVPCSAWPKLGEERISDEDLRILLGNRKIFGSDGEPLRERRLALAIHGIYAIPDPGTWYESKDVQMEKLKSFCHLPINYWCMDHALLDLSTFLREQGEASFVVGREVIYTKEGLDRYVDKNRKAGEEGVCVVQSGWDKHGEPMVMPHSIKIKNYDPVDMAIMGVFFVEPEKGLSTPENISHLLVGLYDKYLGYLPAHKVNLDPNAVQVKRDSDKARLEALRKEIFDLIKGGRLKVLDRPIKTLKDAFIGQGTIKLAHLLKLSHPLDESHLTSFISCVPRGTDLVAVLDKFVETGATSKPNIGSKGKNKSKGKRKTLLEEYVNRYSDVLGAISKLDKRGLRYFRNYFRKAREIKARSGKMDMPDMAIDPGSLAIEIRVFTVMFAQSPYPSGFHTYYGDSFRFENCFPEAIRYDKTMTTDVSVVINMAKGARRSLRSKRDKAQVKAKQV